MPKGRRSSDNLSGVGSLTQMKESRLSTDVNQSARYFPNQKARPTENILSQKVQKMWRTKSPSNVTAESGKVKQNINADSIIIGTQVLNVQ